MGVGDFFTSAFQPTNIALVVEDKKLYVSKEELMEQSPVFRNMLSKDYLENRLSEIKLPGKKLDSFICFLRCLLPGINEDITDENVDRVLPIAHEYQTDVLLQNIDDLLAKNSKKNEHELTLTEIIDNIIEAEVYKMDRYLEVNIDIASREQYLSLILESRFKEISASSRHVIAKRHWEYRDRVYCMNHEIKEI